ncbi:hypothetical protein HDE68_004711 [Pedobacter cryoconitis]|uniref:Carboxypeptidase-like protein n=1 Tax=Pedobacter cryoconitis TaxID=188932 RepID=A0A7W8ZRB2_9SPHI|nr:carboxypeptidase-like regulatory domain-containing protein [Pedobacter cryoconitis]MBB5638776.1 hypothetical protein [Pedobacter cryoconitis]
MKKISVVLAMLFFTVAAYAQNSYKAIIKDAKTNQVLAGATLKILGTDKISVSDSTGLFTLKNISAGKQLLQFSYAGFEHRTDTVNFPLIQTTPAVILLETAKKELEEVFISATRGTRTISNIPTRVEVITGEELDEKGNMKPWRYSYDACRKYRDTNSANICHQWKLQYPDTGA